MEFMKALIEVTFATGMSLDQESYTKNKLGFRQFEPIRLNNDLWLSIQASCVHYCKPKETLNDLYDYTNWEVALYDNHNFVRVADVLPNFSSLAELELYNQIVYANVPADLVEELYVALKKELQPAEL